MKKILFLLLLSVFVITSQAQLGFKGGVNVSTVRGSDVSDVSSKVGFYVGPYYIIPIGNGAGIQTEAVYSAEGAKDNSSSDKIDLGYINLSACFRYMFSGGVFVQTGPQYGFLISAKAKDGTTTDIKDAFKSGNFAWAFAAGYDMKSGFGFYARYNLGLSKIADDGSDVKTGCFQFGLRYTLHMGNGK